MKKLIILILALATVAEGTEFKHGLATIDVPGTWEKDKESSDATLIFNSIPKGKQIVVSVIRLNKEAESLDEIVDAVAKMFALRLTAAKTLSPDVKFENPEINTTASSVVCICRGFAAKEKLGMAIRIEGHSKTVRSTSVYDHSVESPADFDQWSASILDAMK